MSESAFNQTIQGQLDHLAKELSEVKDVVYGRPHAGWQGVVARVESTEQRVINLKEIQDSFIRDQERERREAARKEKFRDKVQVAALGLIGTILAGIVIQLFLLLAGGPA